MAIGHIAVRVHTRTRGHSAAAALAYRAGVRLRDSRTGDVHDYRLRARRGVVASGIAGGGDTPIGTDLQTLADAIENAERRRDSCIARDVQPAIPIELTEEDDRVKLVCTFAEKISARYGTVVAWAVHRSDARSDARNAHAHVIVPTRTLDDQGQFDAKLRQLDDRKRGPAEIREIRTLWQDLANAALVRAGHEARVNTGRRTDGQDPQPTLGPASTAIERRAHAELRPTRRGVSVAKMVVRGDPVTARGAALAEHTRDRIARGDQTVVAPPEARGKLTRWPTRQRSERGQRRPRRVRTRVRPPREWVRDPRRADTPDAWFEYGPTSEDAETNRRDATQFRRLVESVCARPGYAPGPVVPQIEYPAAGGILISVSTAAIEAAQRQEAPTAPGADAGVVTEIDVPAQRPSSAELAARFGRAEDARREDPITVLARTIPVAVPPPADPVHDAVLGTPEHAPTPVVAREPPRRAAAPAVALAPPQRLAAPRVELERVTATPELPAPSPIQPPELLPLPSTSDVAAVVAPELPTPVRITERLRHLREVREAAAAAPTPVASSEDDLELDQVQPTAAEEEFARSTVARIATADRLRHVGEQLLRRHAGERLRAPALPELGATASETTIALVRTQTQRWQTRAPDRLPSALARWRSWWAAGHGGRVVASVIETVWRVVWSADRAEEQDRQLQLQAAAASAAEQQRQLVYAITLQTTAAAGESLIREHGGEVTPSATSWFAERGLGPRASEAAVHELLPHVLAHSVREHTRRPSAIARFHQWWREAGKAMLVEIQLKVWPVHKEESKAGRGSSGSTPEVEVAPIAQRPTRRPAGHGPGRFER